jgi:hypothetical protein
MAGDASPARRTIMHRSTPSPRRRSALWTALLAVSIVIVSPILGVTAAHADAPGYVGVPSGPEGTWGDVTLAPMTEGVFYSDTVQAPPAEAHTWGGLNMPAGLQVVGDGDSAHIEGTPSVSGSFDFTVRASGGDFWWNLEFTGSIAPPPLASTTTMLTGQSIGSFFQLNLEAQVTGTDPTGQVQFYANGQPMGDPQDLTAGGIADFTGSDSNSGLVGSTATFTAKYLGDANNALSTSNPVDEYIYRQGYVFGNVYDNGSPVVGATIDLLLTPATPSDSPAYTTSTGSDGSYIVNIPPATQADAEKTYIIRATLPDGTVLYYNDDAYVGTQSYTDFADAQATGPLAWENRPFNLYRNTPPTWSDQTLADFRSGSSYSDAVSAVGTGVDFNEQSNALHYAVTAGSLPDGISLDPDTGAITGTPASDDPYDFTITANDLYGSIAKEFSGTTLPVGVAPTWSDDAIGSLQQGVPFTDAVAATGDPTIVYSVQAGTLPDGLTLDADTGAITGTPTVDGEFDFTVQAHNDFGDVTHRFTGTIAVAPVDPDLGLTLDFVPGSNIDDASTTIQASGLMIGSTFTLTLHSKTVTLYVGTVDATGGFSLPVSLPSGIPAGSHSLVLTGIAPDGSVLTSTGWFSIDANGKVLQVSMTRPIEGLAFTGTDAVPGLVFGGSLLLAGALFFSVARLSRRAARNS